MKTLAWRVLNSMYNKIIPGPLSMIFAAIISILIQHDVPNDYTSCVSSCYLSHILRSIQEFIVCAI